MAMFEKTHGETKTTVVRLPPELKEKVEELAIKKRWSMNLCLVNLVTNALEMQEK